MNILILNTFETKGGAAVAGKRLTVALQKQGIQVSLLVMEKKTSDTFVSAIGTSVFRKLLTKWAFLSERLQIFLTNRFHRENLFSVSTGSSGACILHHPLVKKADIIHLHWINQGFLSLQDIHALIDLGKPIVWTMHDMWPCTGICHHARDCSRYLENCGNCMFLHTPSVKDLSYRVFQKKKQYLSNSDLWFVTCSRWLRLLAEKSAIKSGNHFYNIPNPIDTDFFCPGNQKTARQLLKLPENKKLILFGASIASDKRKGVDYLIEATYLLSDLKDEVELIFCGQVKGELSATFGLKAHALGYVSDPEMVVKMYQAADCFVIPSLEENLPNMIMEAMACGIPCVGFNTGGIPEMIKHQETGYVAQYKSAEDLASGIRSLLEKCDDLSFKKNIRTFVLENYSESIIAKRYIQLYTNALKSKNSGTIKKAE